MPDPKEVAQEIIDLVFHTPHVDEGTKVEEIHLLESIADIVDDALVEQDRESRRDAEDNYQV